MTGFVDSLNAAQDAVFNDKAFWPKEEDGDEITSCNLATIAVANKVGCRELDSEPGCESMRADELYHFLISSKVFIPTRLTACQGLANEGNLVLAIVPSWNLHQNEGHVCTLTTGVGDYSGRWSSFTPFCMNLGRTGTCFRRKGVNWAFQVVPEFYLWAPVETKVTVQAKEK